MTLYTRPCDAPGWLEREALHTSQRPAMMRYLAHRARLIEAQEDAQAGEYERNAERLRKHLVTSECVRKHLVTSECVRKVWPAAKQCQLVFLQYCFLDSIVGMGLP